MNEDEKMDAEQSHDANDREEDVDAAKKKAACNESDAGCKETGNMTDVEDEELEKDSPDDDRARVEKDSVSFCSWDSTLDATQACKGKLLLSLFDGGSQFILSGVHANTGVKAGRYFFETKIIESRNFADNGSGKGGQTFLPPQVLRLGFSSSSTTALGDGPHVIFFDSNGTVVHDKSRTSVTAGFQPFQVLGVLLNLDLESPNANTISLFCDGVRKCRPHPLPECLRGKSLFPIVNYKNVVLQVNFGPIPIVPLRFSCRMLADAALEDVEVVEKPQCIDGKCEVLFPVGLLDEGVLDWLDAFLKEHQDYTELSHQAILDSIQKSDSTQQKGFTSREYNSRPGMEFTMRQMSNLIRSVSPVLKRNFIVMEVRNNLLSHERRKNIARFDRKDFKRVAVVVMGEPTDAHKAFVRQKMLLKKREKAVNDVKRQHALEERRKERNGKNGDASKGDDAEKESPSLEDAVKEAEAVELSEEELNQWFHKSTQAELKKELSDSFADFALPTADEGFDEIRYEWQAQEECCKYLKEWIAKHKLMHKVEDLVPGAWFKEKWAEWSRTIQEWRRKHNDFTEAKKKRTSEKRRLTNDAEDGDGESAKGEDEGESVKMVDNDDTDVFKVEDVCDVCNGEPLFANFEYEDWALLNLRFELHLLVHGFRHDMTDPERTSFHENNLHFYYSKYYQRLLVFKDYGCSTLRELLELMKDTIVVAPKDGVIDHLLSDDTPLDNFVKLTEDHRRERQRRVDVGDSTAALKFSKSVSRQSQPLRGAGGCPSHAPPLALQARSRMPPPETGSRYGLGGVRGSSGGGTGHATSQSYRGSGHQPPSFSAQKRPYSPGVPQGSYQQSKHARTSACGDPDFPRSRVTPPSRGPSNAHGNGCGGLLPRSSYLSGGDGHGGSYRR